MAIADVLLHNAWICASAGIALHSGLMLEKKNHVSVDPLARYCGPHKLHTLACFKVTSTKLAFTTLFMTLPFVSQIDAATARHFRHGSLRNAVTDRTNVFRVTQLLLFSIIIIIRSSSSTIISLVGWLLVTHYLSSTVNPCSVYIIIHVYIV